MREVVTVNEELVKPARQVIQVKNFNELVTLALTELVKQHQALPRHLHQSRNQALLY